MSQHIKLSWIQTSEGLPEYRIYMQNVSVEEEPFYAKILGTGISDIIDFKRNDVSEGEHSVLVTLGPRENNEIILQTLLTVSPELAPPRTSTDVTPNPVSIVTRYSNPDLVDATFMSRSIDSQGNGFLLASVWDDYGMMAKPVYTFTGDSDDFYHTYPYNDYLPIISFGVCMCGEIQYRQFEERPITADIQYKNNKIYIREGIPLYHYIHDVGPHATGADHPMFNSLDETGKPQILNYYKS